MDTHMRMLLGSCRLCGGNVDLKRNGNQAKDSIKLINQALEVDIAEDDSSIHPPNICCSCRLKLKRWRNKKNTSPQASGRPNIDIVQWSQHSGECKVCPSSASTSPAEAAREAANQLGIVSWVEGGATVFVKWSRGGLSVERHLIIHTDSSWQATIRGNNITASPMLSLVPYHLSTSTQACELLTEVFGRDLCVGNIGFDDVIAGRPVLKGVKGEVVGIVSQVPDITNSIPTATCQTVHFITCKLFIDTSTNRQICTACQSYRSTLFASRNKHRDIIKENLASSTIRNDYLSPEQLSQKMHNIQKERQTLMSQNKALKEKIQQLYEKEAIALKDEQQDQLLERAFKETEAEMKEQIGDNAAFKLLYEEQQKALSVKDSRQVRWHPAIIRFCIAIYSKSSATYNLIRNSPFLKLPHQTTLQKYMKFTTPQVGVNPDVLDFIAKDWDLENMPDFKRNVTLVFDEMKLKSGLAYSKTSGKLVGYTDLGPITNELESFEQRVKSTQEPEALPQPQIATQMLVLMARGIFSPMRVPVAYFPTKNATSHQLYHCIWPTVKALSLIGLTVRAFVADGASWNRKFFSHHTFSKTPGSITYYTKHRFLRNERLYFLCDVPHLVKTTRNIFENSGWNAKSRNLHFNHQDIKWTHLVDLWKWDRGEERSSPGFRMLKNIGESHIYLNPSLRMKVSLAAQVLSTSVANCLTLQGRHDTKSTEYFIRMFDKFFDCLNVKTQYQWIQANKPVLKPYTDVNDERFKWLLDVFLPWLDKWEKEAMAAPLPTAEKKRLCLSEQTLEGLRITVFAFVELAQDLLSQPGVEYLCSDKLNQDVLEEWFSLARGAGGTNTNPTAKELGDIYLNLLVAGSNAVASTRGNCRNQKRTIQLDDTALPRQKKSKSNSMDK